MKSDKKLFAGEQKAFYFIQRFFPQIKHFILQTVLFVFRSTDNRKPMFQGAGGFLQRISE